MSEQTQAVIEAVTSKEGATNGKAWRKFSVKTEDGEFYSTFQKDVAEAAHALVGQRAEILWTPSKNPAYKDILGARAVNGSAAIAPDHGADVSAIPTARTENGTADWDVIGLRKTRCLLWAEYLGGPLAAGIPTPDEVYRRGVDLITKAERDIYWREPASDYEDIPFG